MKPDLITTPWQAYELALLALCIWREAEGESREAKYAVAWSIHNRVAHPGWWGTDYPTCILKEKQYSSFNVGNPRSTLFPQMTSMAWIDSLLAAVSAYTGDGPDQAQGSTNYHDTSIAPPDWALKMVKVMQIGKLDFYRMPE